jgi:hypothetical protein
MKIHQCIINKQKPTDPTDNGDDNGSMFRKIFACLYIPYLWIFAIAFIVVIAISQ